MSNNDYSKPKKPLDLVEEEERQKEQMGKKRFPKIAKIIDSTLNKIIPEFAPKLKIEEKLIDNEINKDYTLIRYYSELQILAGFVIFIFGLIAFLTINGLYLLVLILGILLVLTGFDLEEIYVTNKRLLIRRIGLLERIIRIPSDEEHLLRHIVSFNIGRAPVQRILMTIAAIGFFAVITLSIGGALGMLVIITSFVFFLLAMRLGKRIVTLNLAGGHYVILGLRKGVPTHLIKSIMSSTFTDT